MFLIADVFFGSGLIPASETTSPTNVNNFTPNRHLSLLSFRFTCHVRSSTCWVLCVCVCRKDQRFYKGHAPLKSEDGSSSEVNSPEFSAVLPFLLHVLLSLPCAAPWLEHVWFQVLLPQQSFSEFIIGYATDDFVSN